MLRALARLLGRLERSRERARAGEVERIEREIDELADAALQSIRVAHPDPPSESVSGLWVPSPELRARLLLGTAIVAVLGVIALAGARFASRPAVDPMQLETSRARLIFESRPENAQLRILDAESEELLYKVPSGGVEIEMEPGRYELEVSREDCPDRWTRAIELEDGETRRYEPTICEGAGELVVRSNVLDDRVQIDQFDVGPTRDEPHLLGVGDHVIRVEKSGFAPFEARVRIKPGERQEIQAQLSAASAASGTAGGPGSLPFEVGVPNPPPEAADASAAKQLFEGQEAFVPEPVLPEQLAPQRLGLPDPVLDLELASETGRLPKGGSTTWHDAVSRRILKRFDTDASGKIDQRAETDGIPCTFWRDLERSFDKGGLGLSMARLYGFDGSEWHPKALGFDRSQRVAAYELMKACGLKP